MRKVISILTAMALSYGVMADDDYTFALSYGNVEPDKSVTLDNGITVVNFASGTDLNNLGLTAELPDGASVSPDPSSALIIDSQPEVFTVTYSDGTIKAFPYYFTAGRWFSVVIFSDPEVSVSVAQDSLKHWVNSIIGMEDGGNFAFQEAPWLTPSPDLVVCLGDMDDSKVTDASEIEAVFDLFTAESIPFVTLCGELDFVPDYWSDGSYGATSDGLTYDTVSLGVVTKYLESAQENGVSDVKVFTQEDGTFQPSPFTFTFNGVRFYAGQTYWFQKTHNYSSDAPTYYAPNDIIDSLEVFVEAHADEPSVWLQHYPLGCSDGVWEDSVYISTVVSPSNTAVYSDADDKREEYEKLVSQTKNPYLFAGHNHEESATDYTYKLNKATFTEYVTPYFAERGGAYVVLCHEGEGVKEVQTIYFDF